MSETVNPQPQELQEKLARIGWTAWEPTPGVTDEDEQVYVTVHLHAMSAEAALSLSDEELNARMWKTILNPREPLIEYQRRAGIGGEV